MFRHLQGAGFAGFILGGGNFRGRSAFQNFDHMALNRDTCYPNADTKRT